MREKPLHGPRLRKSIIYSAIVHLILITSMSVVPGIYIPFRDKPMRVDVMWVELPKGTSDDIGMGIKDAQGLPKSTIEEQKNLFQPESTAQQALSPELKGPPQPSMVEPAQKAKPEPRPTIDTSKMKIAEKGVKPAPPTSKTDRKIKDALAMIDKQLTGRQVVPEAGQVASDNNGYKYGTSDKPLRVAPSDPEYLKYQATVRAKIIREWIVPTTYTNDVGKNYSSTVEVMINMDGEVVSVRWAKKSANPSFDQSALRAVKKASPFPKPPDRLAWEAYNEGFLVEFDARLKPQ